MSPESEKSHYQWSDDAFEKDFHEGRFSLSIFTHEAHVRLAWIHLRKYGEEKAIIRVSEDIRHAVTAAGAKSKFNLTLTVAAVKTVNHFMRRQTASSFPEFLTIWPRLITHFRELIETHYARDIFQDEEAKSIYIEPDRLSYN